MPSPSVPPVGGGFIFGDFDGTAAGAAAVEAPALTDGLVADAESSTEKLSGSGPLSSRPVVPLSELELDRPLVVPVDRLFLVESARDALLDVEADVPVRVGARFALADDNGSGDGMLSSVFSKSLFISDN